jgi:hypothetical protein
MGHDIDAVRMNSNRIINFLFASGFIFLFGAVNYAYGQSDFYLEGKVNKSPYGPDYGDDLDITKFEIQVNSSGYKQICPSLQCKIDYKDDYTFFGPPTPPEYISISSKLDFTVQDDITHADLGPKNKERMEQYGSWINCLVTDIVEENGQELYYCQQDNMSNIYATFNNNINLLMNVNATYDAKNNIFKLSGNFTGP